MDGAGAANAHLGQLFYFDQERVGFVFEYGGRGPAHQHFVCGADAPGVSPDKKRPEEQA